MNEPHSSKDPGRRSFARAEPRNHFDGSEINGIHDLDLPISLSNTVVAMFLVDADGVNPKHTSAGGQGEPRTKVSESLEAIRRDLEGLISIDMNRVAWSGLAPNVRKGLVLGALGQGDFTDLAAYRAVEAEGREQSYEAYRVR